MDRAEFVRIRKFCDKTQKQFSELLGVSVKAVQGYEQGWRSIPGHIERMVYLLIYKRTFSEKTAPPPCWDRLECPDHLRTTCPAWEFHSGDLCWLVCGTICGGIPQNNWDSKMEQCRRCPVLRSVIESIP